MPEVVSRTDKSGSKGASSVGTVVQQSSAQKKYEQAIEEWVSGKGTYQNVLDHDPYRQERSFLGFLFYLISGRTKNRPR